MSIETVIIFIGLLIFAAQLFKEIFRVIKLPDVLLLLVIGLIIGPILKIVKPEDLNPFSSLFTVVTLVIILFEGGIHIGYYALKRSIKKVFSITILNFIFTTAIVGVLGVYFTELDIIPSLIIGALISGTSSAVIIPLVNQIKIKGENKTILSLESVLNDIFVVVVSLSLIKALQLSQLSVFSILKSISISFLISIMIGMVGGILWSLIIEQIRNIKNSIFTTAAFVFLLYGVAEYLNCSGAMTALVFGITLGNIKIIKLPFLKEKFSQISHGLNGKEKAFFSEIVFLLKTFFYVYIGISIKLSNYQWLFYGLIIMIILYFARALIIRFSLSPETSSREAALISVILPKGLAAAAIASLPIFNQIPDGEMIQGVVYAVILFSTVLSALLVFILNETKLIEVYKLFFNNFKEETETTE